MSGVVALVIGGARGLGRATVRHLVDSGAEAVIAFDYEFDHKFNNNKVIEIKGNAFIESDVSTALDVCKQRFGRLDILINCGFFKLKKESTSQSISLEEFSNILELNTNSIFNTIRLALGLMSDKQPIDGLRGLVINTIFIPLVDNKIPDSERSAPSLSESIALGTCAGAIKSMTLPLARELGRQGIRCTAIEVPIAENQELFSSDLTKSFVHLIEKITENQMINGNVITLSNQIGVRSSCKL